MIKYDLYDDFRSYVQSKIIHYPKESFDVWAIQYNSEYILRIAEQFINEKHLNANPYKILATVKNKCISNVGNVLFGYYNIQGIMNETYMYRMVDYVSPLCHRKDYELSKNDLWTILNMMGCDSNLDSTMKDYFSKFGIASIINNELKFEAIRIYKTGKCKLTKIMKEVVKIVEKDKE